VLQSATAGVAAGELDVATDLAESYRAGMGNTRLVAATRVADPFHGVRVANRRVENVRRLPDRQAAPRRP
jgi:transposase